MPPATPPAPGGPRFPLGRRGRRRPMPRREAGAKPPHFCRRRRGGGLGRLCRPGDAGTKHNSCSARSRSAGGGHDTAAGARLRACAESGPAGDPGGSETVAPKPR